MNVARRMKVASRAVAASLAAVCSAAACAASTRMTDPPPSGTLAGADGAPDDVAVDGSPDVEPAIDADASPDDSATPAPSVRDAFSASCGTCEAGQKCAPGHGGEYCVAPCPGQPCPPAGPQVPYCDAFGGVHCMAS
jgi:hypothetical protein